MRLVIYEGPPYLSSYLGTVPCKLHPGDPSTLNFAKKRNFYYEQLAKKFYS